MQLAHCFDEADAVVVVLLDAGGDGEDVGVEDDVSRVEADLVDKDLVCPRTDGHFALNRIRLSLLVEGHHDHRGAETPDDAGLLAKLVCAFF